MTPRRLLSLFPTLILLALVGATLPTAEAQRGTAKIEPLLLDRLAVEGRADFLVTFVEQADLTPAYALGWTERGQFVVDALTAAAERAQGAARSYLDGRGLRHRTFIAGNELYVWAGDLAAAEALAARPEVGAIRATRTYFVDPILAAALAAPEALSWGIADTKADQFWTTFGLQGDGIVVANIDTGVQWNHPALDQAFKCGANPTDPVCWADPSNICGGVACDNNGHGTHTMGTMVGDDDPGLAYQVGMAPNALWIACKGCESSSCSDYALNTCADWILAPGGNAANRPHVVNNSWGSPGCDDWYLDKVNAWRAAGIFPAFSAGNAGPDCSTLGSPGDYQESFTSAAHDSGRAIAPFSSRGPSCFGHDPYTKPNLSAPGVSICSAVPGNGWNCTYSGTSMASPHSAGAVALLWSCNPDLIGQIDATFQLLQNTADTPPAGNCDAPGDGGNYTYGYGYLNVLAAGQHGCAVQERWRAGPAVCFDLTRFDAEFFPATGRVYVLGGRSGAATDGNIYWFDPATNECGDTGVDMPNPISNYTANLVNDGQRDLLCTFGGRQADGTSTLNVQCYDPLAGSAFVKTTLPAAWAGYVPGAQVVAQNHVYIFGGFNPTSAPYDLARTERYDPQTGDFTQLGDLTLARSYLMAAVVDDAIYAFGGTVYDGTSLVAQVRTERTSLPGSGWYDSGVPELSTASAEGRAWGFPTRSTYLYRGQVVLAGGGQWPNETDAALLYAPTLYAYDESVPDLIEARRDHAGVFVPLCTADPDDGLPGLWVFGGRHGSDSPPYPPAEYLPLPCGMPEPPACRPSPGQNLASSHPEQAGASRGIWSSTDFQVLNLALDTQPFTARFLDRNGEQIYQFGDSLPGGGSDYYDPGSALPVGFTGTLVLETPIRAAMGIVHLEDPPEEGGNTIFPAVSDERLGHTAYTPIEYCTRLVVHNLNPSAGAKVGWYVLDTEGFFVGGRTDTVLPLGTVTLNPVSAFTLPVGFEGSAIVVADQVIEVTTRSDCHGYSAFVAPPYCGSVLYIPSLPEGDLVGVSLVVQNPTPDSVQVLISYTGGISYTWVTPWGTQVVTPLPGSGGGPVTIHADAPVVAVVRYASPVPGAEGRDAYRAYAPEEISTAAALPVLFADFRGWETDAQIRVLNIGPEPADVRVRYVSAPEGRVFWDRATVRPGESGRFARPPQMPAGTRAAAIVLADQPILTLATAHSAAPGSLDRQVTYAGTSFFLTYQLVTNPTISYTVAGRTVHLAGSAAGTTPILYEWDFGDGARGTGETVDHTYGAADTYTVVMTATNVWGFGTGTASQVVDLSASPTWEVYLPVVCRDQAGR